MARRGRENFRFTAVELTALAASFTVTSVLVFLLGFYVGREVSAEHAPVAENVARVPVGAPPAETAPPRPASRAPQAATARTAAASSTQPKAPAVLTPSPAAQPSAKPESPQAPGPAAQAPPAAPTPPGVPFTVQVLATRNRTEADALTGDLKRRGFGAYVAAVEDAGGTWYRVRIGHFDNADAARRTAERASREVGLTQAYVSPIYSDAR